MKRVLHVVTSLEQGGMENGVCNLSIGLQGRGFQTHIACIEKSGVFAKRLPDSIQVITLGKRNGFSPSVIWSLHILIRSFRPALVHTHNLGPLIYSSIATFGGKICPILHGEHSQLAHWEKTSYRLMQRRFLYRACRSVHTVSSAQIPEIESLIHSRVKLSAIPNGVDTDHYRPSLTKDFRIKYGIPLDALALGLVGRFGPFKGHEKLLAAFELMACDVPNLHLIFIGAGGSEEQRVKTLASCSPYQKRIHFIGYLSDPASGYCALDLLLIPSTNEGMSNAAIEAMSCGIAVIANINCGNEQIISNGTNGIIADLSTPFLIRSQLDTFLNSPELLNTIRANARSAVISRFSMAKMLSEYSNLYSDCIGAG